MTAAEVADLVANARQHFEEGLLEAGFSEDGEAWLGTVVYAGGAADVRVVLPSKFPFVPPRVTPSTDEDAPWSWHRERDGALCFVAEDDHEGLWWVEASNVLDQVAAWFEHAAAGWVGDRPDLDLDRYFAASDDDRIFIYGELDPMRNSHVRIEPERNDTMRLLIGASGARRTPKSQRRGELFGYVADLGEVDIPPRNWADIEARTALGRDLTRQIVAGSVTVLGLLYDRGGREGLILLRVKADAAGAITAERLVSAADTRGAREARSGSHAPVLAQKRVAIVGVGALGSFIADALARSGVGELTLVDTDVLLPGNLVRHVASPTLVGKSKVEAVQLHLAVNDHLEIDKMKTVFADARDTDVVVALLSSHDLVVNATADFAVTAALHHSASALGLHVLSAAIQNDGDTFRIDILPPIGGAEPLPTTARATDGPITLVFEAGCGSPVSPTPPYVVMEAAGAAARHAVGLLTGTPSHPAGEARHLLDSNA